MSDSKEVLDDKNLNPQVVEATIGTRHLRKIKIYPLSMADQSKVTAILTKEIVSFFNGRDVNSIPIMEFVEFVLNAIQKNFVEILKYVTDPEDIGDADNILTEISNVQAAEIASLIYETNYAALMNVKNVKSLLKLIQNSFQLRGPLPQSAKNMDTIRKTSTKKASKKVA